MASIADSRPPYVTFELRAEEDRAESIARGHFVSRDVPYAVITPQGSKDQIERKAEEWLDQLRGQVQSGRFPREWLTAFSAAFEDWKAGNEPALNGTDVRNWPAVSPAQVMQLRQARLFTVEDLASANEEALTRLGMGGRSLKAKAAEWLHSASDFGKQAEVVAALRAENADLQSQNKHLVDIVEKLGKRLDAVEGAKGSGDAVLSSDASDGSAKKL